MKKNPWLIPVSSLLFICTALSCSDGSSGGSGSDSGTQNARSGDTVYETEAVVTQAGNTAADTLRLYQDGTFELIKTASYEDVRAAATFCTGTYSGDVISGLTFDVKKQLDESQFTDGLKTAFNISGSGARNAAARAALSADKIKELINECKELLAKLELTDSIFPVQLRYSSSDLKETGSIDLSGFLLTGDFCPVVEREWAWATTESEGASSLHPAGNGIYECSFIASRLSNELYTRCRLMKDNWKEHIGYADIDTKNSQLPSGVQIVMDSERLSGQWADIENIIFFGVNNLSTYHVQFDTASMPGTIRIIMKETKKAPAAKDIIGQNFENLYARVSTGENNEWDNRKVENRTLTITSYRNTEHGGYNTGVNFSSRNPFADWPAGKYCVCDSIGNFGLLTEDGATYWLWNEYAAAAETYTLTFSWTDDGKIKIDIAKN